MGARGPHKKPTALKVLEGTLCPTRDKGRAKEPRPGGCPEPPAHLDAVAREHWDRVVPELVELRVARGVDEHALVLLCQAWSDLARLRGHLDPEGKLDLKLQYAINAARKSWTDLAGRFGLTPADRTKIETEGPTADEAAARFVV